MAEIKYLPTTIAGSTATPPISHETPPAIASLLRYQQTMPEPQMPATVTEMLTGNRAAAAQVAPERIRYQTRDQQPFSRNADRNLLSTRAEALANLGTDLPQPKLP
jgi:hypothetical protein